METPASSFKQKPPYLMGLLCLIPLLGAFVGLALILFGIIKYKDKWLIMIGAFGILFTVGIYYFMFYYMQYGELSKKGFAEISQMQLNSLVKNIEFYKIQHGSYPDDLQQLLKDDPMAPVHDAVQTVHLRNNAFYNYEKKGDRYELFSSGHDGVPHSKDDLFPELQINDSSKIGLITH
jgi:hypothetical protein